MRTTLKLKKINELIKIIDNSLKDNCQGFLTYYTEKIIKLTTPIKTRIPFEYIPQEKINIIEERRKKEWRRWEISFDFYMNNSPEFKIKANNILSKIFINKEIRNDTI